MWILNTKKAGFVKAFFMFFKFMSFTSAKNLVLKISLEWRKYEENSGLDGFRAHDLYDTGTVIYQLSDQAI